METEKVFYYSGASARPHAVQVLVLSDQLHVSDMEGMEHPLIFPLAATVHNKVGSHYFIYLDKSGLSYLHFHKDHELAGQLCSKAGIGTGWYARLMQQKLALLLPLLLMLAAALYFVVITAIPFLGAWMITKEQEKLMGDRLHEVLLQQSSLSGDTIDSAGTRKLQAFADHIRLSDTYTMQVTLVRSDIVNAYALPGGHIVVYSALLDQLQSPESLAALLSHESAHINERHSLKSLLRNAANSILISIIFGDVSGISGAVVGNAQSLNGLSYSRKLEKEADEKGMELLHRNNIPLKGMEELMQTLQKQGDLPRSLSFLSSHPLTRERARRASEYARTHPQAQTMDTTLTILFKAMK